jgi:hypothetical protein
MREPTSRVMTLLAAEETPHRPSEDDGVLDYTAGAV